MQIISCCYTQFQQLSNEDFVLLDKALGNIKKSQKSITFLGLVNVVKNKAMLMHYLTSPTFSMPVEVDDKPVNHVKVLQAKIDQVLERIISFRMSQVNMCKELGFDCSRETYLKGDKNIIMILDLKKEYHLVIMMEMN